MQHDTTRGEACHWILSRLTAPYESSSLATARNDGGGMVSYIWQLSETLRSNGFAAMGTLMTVTLKREDDSTGDSLLRRELPTGLRDGDGSAAGWISNLKSFFFPHHGFTYINVLDLFHIERYNSNI